MTRISTLTITDGVRVVVPDSLDLITPYILCEQQDWFEDEIGFLRRIVRAGQKVVDIGANYGVYTLSMARTVGTEGAVWAFEPASCTADFLRQGIAANGFSQVNLECSALSDEVGSARLATGEHAELNALERGASSEGAGETVRVVTLDEAMTRHGWIDIDFLKIDAEGEEHRIIAGGRKFFSLCSPLVLYEVKAVNALHLDLVRRFADLGYASYRLIPGLDVLAPFDPGERADDYLLNLFCCKPDRAAVLAQAGFLVQHPVLPASIVTDPAASAGDRLSTLPYAASLATLWRASPAASGRPQVDRAVDAYLSSRDPRRTAVERLQDLQTAFHLLNTLCAEDPSHLRRASLARVAAELGERSLALSTLGLLYQRIVQGQALDMSEPFLAVTRRFDTLAVQDDPARWLSASILECIEKLSAYSSYFTGVGALARLKAIESLGYASEEMRRRLQLVQLRFPASATV
jgi:FkbM family methyltransferase